MRGDFTIDRYREYVQEVARSSNILNFSQIDWSLPFVLWRHDCDMSLNRARAIAEVDAQEGIESTFFVNIKSEFYNAFEVSQTRLIRDLVSLGRRIGVHIDTTSIPVLNRTTLEHELEFEVEALTRIAGTNPDAFSFHNPSLRELDFGEERVLGLVNSYSVRFRSEVAYCSDSNGYWRFHTPTQTIKQSTSGQVQILTHPEWWLDDFEPPRMRVARAIYGRADRVLDAYDRQMENLGRVNVGQCLPSAIRVDLPEDRLAFIRHLWSRGWHRLLLVELSDFFPDLQGFSGSSHEMLNHIMNSADFPVVTDGFTELSEPNDAQYKSACERLLIALGAADGPGAL